MEPIACMSAYHDVANPDLLARIPLTARVVLDVGCATGALGHAYRRFNPAACLLGVEMNASAASLASERLDVVAVADVEREPLPFDELNGLDCVVYGDVLEHLRDPWAVVRAHADALNQDGVVLLCIPNVENWHFADRLLHGGWDYEPSGLFDATHLRWFSLDSVRRGLVAAGLVPYDVHPRIFDPQRAATFLSAMKSALQALGVDAGEYARRAMPLQFVWRARRASAPTMVIGATMLAPVGGVSHVRVVEPLNAMTTEPGILAKVGVPADFPPLEPESPRIFILHRPVLAAEKGLHAIRRLLENGWLIVTEFDDHPDYFRTHEGATPYAFAGVHAVQTSTPALEEILRARNPEVRVFPNAIRYLPDIRNFRDPASLTLFFGALNRERDWAPLMPMLNAIAARFGDRLRFEVVHDQAFFDALATPHKNFTPTCDYDAYMALLGGCEFSLMPLSDNPFNRAKSDLKFIEAGACRVAALASPIVYCDSIEDGRTGVLFRDAEELGAQLMQMIETPALAQAIGDAARNYVMRERMLAYQTADRIAWYRSLWARRQELTEALLARLADIRRGAGADMPSPASAPLHTVG
jgi:SAM-dependent methyltransferase